METLLGETTVTINPTIGLQLFQGSIDNNNIDFRGLSYTNRPNVTRAFSNESISPDTIRFGCPHLQLEEFDIQAYINDKQLRCDRISIHRPEIYSYLSVNEDTLPSDDSVTPILLYRRLNTKIPEIFSEISISDFDLSDARLVYKLQSDNTLIQFAVNSSLSNIVFNSTSSNKPSELLIEKYGFCVTDATIISDRIDFIAEKLCYNNSDDFISIKNSNLKSVISQTFNSRPNFHLKLPEIILTGPDFVAPSGSPVSFDLLHVKDPELWVLFSGDKEQKSKPKGKIRILPFNYLEDTLRIENAKIDLGLINRADTTFIDVGRIDLDFKDIRNIIGAEKELMISNNLFNHLEFHLSAISIDGPGIKMNVNKLDYKDGEQKITIHPLHQELYKWSERRDHKISQNVIHIPEVNIEKPDLMLADNEIKSFGISKIAIPKVDIDMESYRKNDQNKDKKAPLVMNNNYMRQFISRFDFVHVDSTIIKSIGINSKTISDSGVREFNIERISLLIDSLKLDSNNFDIRQKPIAKDIILQLHDKELISPDSMYDIRAKEIAYNYSKDKIVIDSFEVVPRFDDSLFFKRSVYQTDRFKIKFDRATAEGFDILSLVEDQKLLINKITFNKLHLLDHRNLNYPRKENDFKKLPNQAISSLPFLMGIDTIHIQNSFLLYGEYAEKSRKPGEVYFTNFNASIYNLSNIVNKSGKYNSLYANISADIMNDASMDLNLTFPLHKNADYFWYKGHVDKVDLRKFNSMTENLFGIAIVRGTGEVDIPLITANSINSKGSITFKYKKLKLALYNRNKAKLHQGIGSGLIGILMNDLLIKSNNPTFLGKTRTGDVYFRRNDERSFFHYFWHSIMSGMMSTMGFYNKELREEKRERKSEEKIERKEIKQK
jgi:hypothetical protein